MISTLTWNAVLILPFLLAFLGIPLYMTMKHLDRRPDHSAAREYLAAKAEYLAARASHRRAKAASAAAAPRPLAVHDVLRPLAPADVTEDRDLVLAGRR
jgi:hypothetical protein